VEKPKELICGAAYELKLNWGSPRVLSKQEAR
jgi:hypothetical protein